MAGAQGLQSNCTLAARAPDTGDDLAYSDGMIELHPPEKSIA